MSARLTVRRRFADSLQGLFWYDRTRRIPPVCTADRYFGTAECRAEAPCPDFCRGAAFQQATELAGVHLSFEEGRGKGASYSGAHPVFVAIFTIT